jgi:hypothetical protein
MSEKVVGVRTGGKSESVKIVRGGEMSHRITMSMRMRELMRV